jgi:hypothetical protein
MSTHSAMKDLRIAILHFNILVNFFNVCKNNNKSNKITARAAAAAAAVVGVMVVVMIIVKCNIKVTSR